jgi:broad specificity phosphatase PhoE
MTTFLLIRHASHDWLNRGIAGRRPEIHLNRRGQEEAATLAAQLKHTPLQALYSSPLERTRETAAIISNETGLPVTCDEAFLEIDFGRWTGFPFEQLHEDPGWQVWNKNRETARTPGGESMEEVTARAINGLKRLAQNHPSEIVALVSHGDVIRALVLACAGVSLNEIHRFEIDPASVTCIEWFAEASRVVFINLPASKARQRLDARIEPARNCTP